MKLATALAIAGAALTAAALAAPAQAATPSEAELTVHEPVVEWTGRAPGGAVNFANWANDVLLDVEEGQLIDDCDPQYCDTFKVTLKDAGKLEIVADDGSGYVEMQIRDAQGRVVFHSTGEADVPTVFKRTKAAAGTYTIEVLTDDFGAPLLGDGAYAGTAKLNDGKPAEVPAAASRASARKAGARSRGRARRR